MDKHTLTPLQQQRYDKALEDYWREPVLARLRNDPEVEKEAARIANWAAHANEMLDDEFKTVTRELINKGQESGDVGGEFYSRVVSNLNELRRLSLKRP